MLGKTLIILLPTAVSCLRMQWNHVGQHAAQCMEQYELSINSSGVTPSLQGVLHNLILHMPWDGAHFNVGYCFSAFPCHLEENVRIPHWPWKKNAMVSLFSFTEVCSVRLNEKEDFYVSFLEQLTLVEVIFLRVAFLSFSSEIKWKWLSRMFFSLWHGQGLHVHTIRHYVWKEGEGRGSMALI